MLLLLVGTGRRRSVAGWTGSPAVVDMVAKVPLKNATRLEGYKKTKELFFQVREKRFVKTYADKAKDLTEQRMDNDMDIQRGGMRLVFKVNLQ